MSPVRRFAVGVTVAAVAIFASAAPASAHDELVFSDPADGAQLATAPQSVTMQFSGELLTLGDSMTGAVVLIVDRDGKNWATGDAEVLRDTVTVDVAPGMPEAGYQVRWQVVSEDGHPIAGIIPFTIGDAQPMPTGDGGSTSSADTPQSDPTSAVDGDAQTQTDTETSGAIRILLVGAGGAVLAAAAFALYRFLRRPRATTTEL